ncbi:MAG TPA: 3-dehydroquinate dehydratase, partial [Lachnospiraceae bacterium]|nr:3-dehydroquinate dehydratase [Lachnospiraceae bacterium]
PEQLEKTLARLEGTRDFYDLVELRADIYPFDGIQELSESLRRLRKAVGDKPILFTFRTKEEGGNRDVSFDLYREMNLCAAQEGADLIDLQLSMMEG